MPGLSFVCCNSIGTARIGLPATGEANGSTNWADCSSSSTTAINNSRPKLSKP